MYLRFGTKLPYLKFGTSQTEETGTPEAVEEGMYLKFGTQLPYLKFGTSQSVVIPPSEPVVGVSSTLVYYGSIQAVSAHMLVGGVMTEVNPSYLNI